jgi:hypothetical protein
MYQIDGRRRRRAGRLVMRGAVALPREAARRGGPGLVVERDPLACPACATAYELPRAFLTSSVSLGTISNRSPTMP